MLDSWRRAIQPPFPRQQLPLCLAALAVVTHGGFYLASEALLTPDSPTYISTARSLLEGEGFVAQGLPETRRTPGYPAFLALLFSTNAGLDTVVLLQHALGVAMVVWLFVATARWTGSRNSAALAALLLAVDLPSIEYANLIATEPLFTAALFTSLCLLYRAAHAGRWMQVQAAGSGIALGIATLTRPIALYFLVFPAAYLWWATGGRARRAVVVVLLCGLVLPGAWTFRNFHETGKVTFCSISADSLLYYRAAGVLALSEGEGLIHIDKYQAALKKKVDAEIAASMESPSDVVPHAIRATFNARHAVAIIAAHPREVAQLTAIGVANTMLGNSATAIVAITGARTQVIAVLCVLYTLPCLIFALVGLARLYARNRKLFVLVAMTIGYFVLIPAGAESYSRFRVPITPLYAIAVASGVIGSTGWARSRREARTSDAI